jgi:hypothetical protein
MSSSKCDSPRIIIGQLSLLATCLRMYYFLLGGFFQLAPSDLQWLGGFKQTERRQTPSAHQGNPACPALHSLSLLTVYF